MPTFYVVVSCEAFQGRVARCADLVTAQQQAEQWRGLPLKIGDWTIGEVRDAWAEGEGGWRYPAAQREPMTEAPPPAPSREDEPAVAVERAIICRDCRAAGQRSTVTESYGWSTHDRDQSFYDEGGAYHSHDPATHSIIFRCSNGHEWTEFYVVKCPNPLCDFGGTRWRINANGAKEPLVPLP